MQQTRLFSAILACGLALPAAAPALTAEDVVARFEVNKALCEDAQQELVRQSDVLQADKEAWLAFSRGLQAALEANAALLDGLHDRDRANGETGVAAARSLQPMGSDQSHVPHIGWGIFGYFEQRRDQINQAIAEVDATVAAGTAGFHVAGQGWLTGEQLEARIAAQAEDIAALQAAVDAGTHAIHYPGLGWVTGQQLEACIAAEDQKIADTLQAIADGSYSVHLPHLGWVTRTQVEGMIVAKQAELDGIEAALSDGSLSIHRAPYGWLSPAQLDGMIAGNEDARAALTALIGEGGFAHAFFAEGWNDANQLQARIAAEEAGIAEVQRVDGAGEYAVPTAHHGWLNRNQLTDLLALPDCWDKPGGPNPCIAPSARPHYQDALGRIGPSVATDIEIREQRIALLTAFLAALAAQADPEFQRLAVQRDLYGLLEAEFDMERSAQASRLMREMAWLRRNLDLIP